MMILAIDIGNTHTVVGAHDGNRWFGVWRLSSSARRTPDEVWHLLKSFLSDAGIAPPQVAGIAIASVVPDLTSMYEQIASKYLQRTPLLISGLLSLGIRIHYNDPTAVGADRLCNAIAGFAAYGGPLIIIDFGTATTFDVIAENGDYLGGVIMLGIESEAAELHRRAAMLPKIDLHFPKTIIGKETTASMQSGVLYGTADAVEGMVKRIRNELGRDVRAIATGGLSGLIAPSCPSIEKCEPLLVLDGIRLIYEKVKKS